VGERFSEPPIATIRSNYRTEENGQEVARDISDDVVANSKKLGIEAIITIGGDGSQKAKDWPRTFSKKRMKIAGVPQDDRQ
jgi:6-phosphofructokinase